MSREDLPAHIRAFITEYIRTVVELETLLLLQRQAQRQWSAEELGREMRVNQQYARLEIGDLTQRGLTECTEGAGLCRYAPRTPALDQTVRELGQVYAQRPVAVIQAIYTKPDDPIQSFADAFRFRKERPSNG